jgi:hypothetical protein
MPHNLIEKQYLVCRIFLHIRPQLSLDTLEQVLVHPHVKNSGLALLSHVFASATTFGHGAMKAVPQFAKNMAV